MAKKMKFDDSGDSDDLQALFDSIAAVPAIPRLEVVAAVGATGDSDDLQALFEAVAHDFQGTPAAIAREEEACSSSVEPPPQANLAGDDVFRRVGHMARELHDAMHELGYDRMLEQTARAIPDARQRLSYIAQMTEQAASRVLNATDVAKPIQEHLESRAQVLGAQWAKAYAGEISVQEFKALGDDTRGFLAEVPEGARATNEQLMEIMMAQDFQDLTGQVIKKVVEMAQSLEDKLVHLLVEVTPEELRSSAEGLLNGPVINAAGRTDVVTTQGQVDELLESLGF
jgi:chemotaxis protein CheZ